MLFHVANQRHLIFSANKHSLFSLAIAFQLSPSLCIIPRDRQLSRAKEIAQTPGTGQSAELVLIGASGLTPHIQALAENDMLTVFIIVSYLVPLLKSSHRQFQASLSFCQPSLHYSRGHIQCFTSQISRSFIRII